MRVRRRHAWGAVLIVLFALPVLQPDGIEFLERPVGGFFAWFSRLPALNPQLWKADREDPDGGQPGPRAQVLEQENARLRELIARRIHTEADLKALQRVLEPLQNGGLDRHPRVLLARVLMTADPSGYRQSILIDRGAEDGLEVGMAVVSGPVYVGKVEVVQSRSALVKLVTDRRSRLEVALRTDRMTRLRGYVRGNGRGSGRGADGGELAVRLLVVPDDAGRVLPETEVFTSNADPRIPPSLIVGYVADVRDQDLDGVPTIRLRPALDLGRSTRVFVLVQD